MAQYDIHRVTGRNRDTTPFVIDIQSNEFKTISSKVIIPLTRAGGFPAFAPVLIVNDISVVADALLTTTVRQEKLGPVVRALTADEVGAVMNALDRIISSAYP